MTKTMAARGSTYTFLRKVPDVLETQMTMVAAVHFPQESARTSRNEMTEADCHHPGLVTVRFRFRPTPALTIAFNSPL